MLCKAWNSKGEMPYCFPRSSIKFQGHTGQNITDFDPNWAFPDYRPVAAFKSLRFALLKLISSWSSWWQHCDLLYYNNYCGDINTSKQFVWISNAKFCIFLIQSMSYYDMIQYISEYLIEQKMKISTLRPDTPPTMNAQYLTIMDIG